MTTAPLPDQLRADLESYARLSAMVNLQLGSGVPGLLMTSALRSVRDAVDALIPQLEANPNVLVKVNPRIGDAMGGFLAEHLNPPAPDFPPDDL